MQSNNDKFVFDARSMLRKNDLKIEFQTLTARIGIKKEDRKLSYLKPVFPVHREVIGFDDYCCSDVVLERWNTLSNTVQRTVCKCTCRVIVFPRSF